MPGFEKRTDGLSRRTLMAAAPLALAMPSILRSTPARAEGNLVFVTWGGSYHAAVEEGLVKPFTKETGIGVTIIDTPDLAKVKAQITTGNVEWDVFDAPGAMGASGSKNGFWEPLDPAMFPTADLSVPLTKDLAPFYTAAGGIAWDPKRFPDGKHPRTFAEYFDTTTFPGRRTLRDRISETLEVALLADGVPPAKLYPLDVERGFGMLDKIKPSIIKWVASTPQTITLLQTGEADFSYSYGSRVKTARAAGGTPMEFSFAQTVNALEYLAVVKGAPRKEAAMKFVAYALRTECQAATMELLSNTPVNRKALPLLSEDARKSLPDMENPLNALINDAYWAENFDRLQRRFKEWVLS